MIQGIFYVRFFPREGPKVVAQSPPGCIVPTPAASVSSPAFLPASADFGGHGATPSSVATAAAVPAPARPPLFDFFVLRSYIIPRKSFFNRLVAVNDPDGKYRVLGFPVLIADERYLRNEFIFNFGVVVEADEADYSPYELVVRRLAATFAEMEKQSSYLSTQDDGNQEEGRDGELAPLPSASPPVCGGPTVSAPTRRIESLLEIIREDLNNYGECMIPVDEANTINMKLFPRHPPPPEVRSWHVPVAKMKLSQLVDPTWDLTLQRVIAHIDGVSDVRRLAWAAGVSLDLAKTALRHLLYYDTVLLLDLFFFSSCYAPRPGIHDFVANVDGILDECAAYVAIYPPPSPPPLQPQSASPSSPPPPPPPQPPTSPSTPSRRLSVPVLHPAPHAHPARVLSHFQLIELMTSFCHGKSVMEWLCGHQQAGLDVLRYLDVRRLVQFGVIKGCLYRVHKYPVSRQYLTSLVTGDARPATGPLQHYLDGCHPFDQIIVEQNLTDSEIMHAIKRIGLPDSDWRILHR